MGLRLAASFGVAQTAASIVTSFLSVKITSVVLGPAGIGVLGQFQYIVTLSQGILVAGVTTAVLRRTAATATAGNDLRATARAATVASALRVLLIAGLPIAALVALGSGTLARELLHDPMLQWPLLLFALLYVVGLAASPALGCANGLRDYGAVTAIQIGTGVVGLALLAGLCIPWGLPGAVFAAALMPSAACLIAWAVARRRAWWPGLVPAAAASRPEMRSIAAFIPMAAVSAAVAPLIQLLIRDHLAAHAGLPAVGLLQGVTRLSDLYLSLVSSLMAMYFLPRFSELASSRALRRELSRGIVLLLPAATLAGLALYLARDLVVQLVFTREFAAMRELFAWQMTGNALKVAGWLFGYLLLARIHPFAVAAIELATGLLWWLLAVRLIAVNGAVGATQAYAATYAVYAAIGLIGAAWLLRRMANTEPKEIVS